jgi:ELWxxDGT repeat protein
LQGQHRRSVQTRSGSAQWAIRCSSSPTDGTTAGTSTLSSFAQNQYGLVSDSIALNGKVYVALNSSLSCCQPDLWATDGTSAGTVRIDSNEGYPTFHLQPSSLEAFGSSVALLTDTENQGVQLSMVNTTSNALTILDTTAGASYGSTIAAMDGFILFLSGNPNNGVELWRSDGTLPGTALVTNMGQGVQFSQLGQNIVMTRVGDRAIFQSENAQNGPQLWSSDGTAAGTVPLIATPTPSGSGYSQPLLALGGLALLRGLRPNTRAPSTGSIEFSMTARHLLAKCTSFTAQPNAGTQRVCENCQP